MPAQTHMTLSYSTHRKNTLLYSRSHRGNLDAPNKAEMERLMHPEGRHSTSTANVVAFGGGGVKTMFEWSSSTKHSLGLTFKMASCSCCSPLYPSGMRCTSDTTRIMLQLPQASDYQGPDVDTKGSLSVFGFLAGLDFHFTPSTTEDHDVVKSMDRSTETKVMVEFSDKDAYNMQVLLLAYPHFTRYSCSHPPTPPHSPSSYTGTT